MIGNQLPQITIQDLKNKIKDTKIINNDIIITSIGKEYLKLFSHPCCIDGFAFTLCRKGKLEISVNLHNYSIEKNVMFLNTPDNFLQVNQIDDSEEVEIYAVLISSEFLSQINVNYRELMDTYFKLKDSPYFVMDEEDVTELLKYYHLIEDTYLNYTYEMKINILKNLISGFIYTIFDYANKHINTTKRQHNYSQKEHTLRQFIQLVGEHHATHRTIAFYANELCLTPKYLSSLIKETSGKTVMDWINSYVILAAKTMLSYTDKSVKEISTALNFQSQSFFSKYFKRHTAMTPFEFRTKQS